MNDDDIKRYDEVRDARHAWFTRHLGPLPDTVMKCASLGPAWPGGGLYHVAARADAGRPHAYFTDGLTNAGLPTGVRVQASPQGGGRFVASRREPRAVPAGRAGYGYELVALSEVEEPGLLQALARLVEMEVLSDVDRLRAVDHDGSATLEDLALGPEESGDFLLQLARAPLPDSVGLPNGSMRVLTLTWITRDEMEFALAQGRPALLERLAAAGVGPVSILGRASVLDTAPLAPGAASPESMKALEDRITRLSEAMLDGGPQQWSAMSLEGRFTKDAQGRPRTVRGVLRGRGGEAAVVTSVMQAAAAEVTRALFRQGEVWDQWSLTLTQSPDGEWNLSLQVKDDGPPAPPEPAGDVPPVKPWWKFW